jgi:hypothetical protein
VERVAPAATIHESSQPHCMRTILLDQRRRSIVTSAMVVNEIDTPSTTRPFSVNFMMRMIGYDRVGQFAKKIDSGEDV